MKMFINGIYCNRERTMSKEWLEGLEFSAQSINPNSIVFRNQRFSTRNSSKYNKYWLMMMLIRQNAHLLNLFILYGTEYIQQMTKCYCASWIRDASKYTNTVVFFFFFSFLSATAAATSKITNKKKQKPELVFFSYSCVLFARDCRYS